MTTKVLMTTDLLEYREGMKEELRKVIQENYIEGVEQCELAAPTLAWEKLLPAPQIMALALDSCEGEDGDFIGIVAFHDFGIHSMHITIRDELGNRIEGDEADPMPNGPHLFEFYPQVRIPRGTTVIVEVVAMDCMGGIGVWRQRERMP